MKKIIITTVVGLIAIIAVGSFYFSTIKQTNRQPATEPKTEGYYEGFRKKCDGSGCCLSSVSNAEQANSLIYEGSVTNVICPGGLAPVMNKCIDSYKWCLSATK